MSQVTEPALVDYARFYGLTLDHLEIDPLAGLLGPEDPGLQLQDGPRLFKIDEAVAKVPEEKLVLGKDGIQLLSSLTNIPEYHPNFDGVDLDPHRVRDMKVELPILRSDHDLDMQDFARTVVPDLANEHLPLESLDEEADEGLSWPSRYSALPEMYSRKSTAEKLEVSPDLLDYMRNAIDRESYTTEHMAFEAVEILATKKPQIEHITPPLLPMSPPWLPYEPSSETGRLELLSEPLSPTLQELQDVNRKIFEGDAIGERKFATNTGSQDTKSMLLDSESVGDFYSPLRGIKDPPSSPALRKAPLASLKVEAPLTPLHSEQPPPWQRRDVTHKEGLREVIASIPSPIASSKYLSSEDFDTFISQTIAPIAAKAERGIEQEQLQEADTMYRVPVPVMDLSLPTAPWKGLATIVGVSDGKDNVTKQLLEMKNSHFSKHHWPGVGEMERSLQWMPFPAALGHVETYETIGDDGMTEISISVPECMDSSTLTWKPEGLRLFDDLANTEEELETGDFPEAKDIESLVKKRKRELQQELEEDTGESGNNTALWATTKRKPINHEAFRKVPRLSPRMSSRPKETKDTKNVPGKQGTVTTKPFSALESLENFMSLRNKGPVTSKLTAEHHFPEQKSEAVAQQIVQKDPHPVLPASEPASHYVNPSRIAAPQFVVPTSPMPFVVSTVFLRNRKLARHIQRLMPTAEFIERDFTLHSAPKMANIKNGSSNEAHADMVADEADIILSPSSGLILTTLQMIKQRSLPGQAAKSALRERITRVAPRYERLIVIITSGNNDNYGPDRASEPTISAVSALDQNDCEALIDFTSFCASVLEETQVILAKGDTEDLAQWIASLMTKHCIQDPEVKLLQDETLWEIFLRRVGMNAFAAQVILSELKAPPDTAQHKKIGAIEKDTDYGLTAFVKMSLQERLVRFELLLGGRRILERVSRVLDARW